MKRLGKFVSFLALLGFASQAPAARAQTEGAPPERPNFLVIVADDLGYSDIGAFGGEIDTPNLDALAASGLKLSDFHSAPTCSPTRSMLLSGLDHHEAGLGTMAEVLAPNQRGRRGYEGYLRRDAASLAELLGGAGYRTFFSGKWHLGVTSDQDPSRRGFQNSFVLLQASHNHFGAGLSVDPALGFTYRQDGRALTELPSEFYSSDFFATRLIEQLRESENSEDKRKPFFAYLAFTAPHFPLQAPLQTIAKYHGRYEQGYEALRQRRLARQVELGLLDKDTVPHEFDIAPPWTSLTGEQQALASRRMEVYAAMVDRLDQNVGRVIQALRESGELERTIVLFLSDNGADGMLLGSLPEGAAARARHEAADNSLENIGSASSYDSIGPGWAEALNAPYWRFKGSQTEGGTRVVAFLAGPGIRRGIGAAYTSVMDVAPTLLELADVPQPKGVLAGRAVQPIRGRSWVPWLTGRVKRVYSPHQAIGGELLGGRALRQGQWKLVDAGDGRWRLFNIAEDPGETRDMSASAPERTVDMARKWESYSQDVGVVIPHYKN